MSWTGVRHEIGLRNIMSGDVVLGSRISVLPLRIEQELSTGQYQRYQTYLIGEYICRFFDPQNAKPVKFVIPEFLGVALGDSSDNHEPTDEMRVSKKSIHVVSGDSFIPFTVTGFDNISGDVPFTVQTKFGENRIPFAFNHIDFMEFGNEIVTMGMVGDTSTILDIIGMIVGTRPNAVSDTVFVEVSGDVVTTLSVENAGNSGEGKVAFFMTRMSRSTRNGLCSLPDSRNAQRSLLESRDNGKGNN